MRQGREVGLGVDGRVLAVAEGGGGRCRVAKCVSVCVPDRQTRLESRDTRSGIAIRVLRIDARTGAELDVVGKEGRQGAREDEITEATGGGE